MKPYGFPKLDTCCKRCYRRSKETHHRRNDLCRKRRARAAGKRAAERPVETDETVHCCEEHG